MGLFDSVHEKAAVGVFGPDSAKQAWGLLAGALPGGMGAPPARNTADYLRGYSQFPWLRAVAMRVSTAVASADWQLFVVDGKNGKAKRGGIVTRIQRGSQETRSRLMRGMQLSGTFDPYRQRKDPNAGGEDVTLRQVTDHPMLDVLTQANSFQTGLAMRKLTQIHLDLVGDAFWLKERDAQGTVIGVWPIPPHWVIATPTPQFRYFRVSFRAWRGIIPDTEFVWFSEDDPMNPYARGTGIAQALGDELETDEYAARHTKAFFYNQARPDMLVWPKSGNMTPGNVKRLEEDWLSNVQGFFRAFKPYFLSREVEVKTFDNNNMRSMQFVQLREFERDTILQVYGVPPEILGVLEHSNRATITSADYLMSRYVVVPRLEFLRSVLQERFAPEYDERLIVDYVSPVQADDDLKLQVATVAPWAPSLDEWRAMAGLPPMEDLEAGAQHLVNINTKPRTLAIDEEPDIPPPVPGQGAAPQPGELPGGGGSAEDSGPAKRRRAMQLTGSDVPLALAAAVEAGDLALAQQLQKATSLDLSALPAPSAVAARQEPSLARALVKAWKDHAAGVSLPALEAALAGHGTVGDAVDALDLDSLAEVQSDVLEKHLVVGFLRGAEVGGQVLRRHGVMVRAAAPVRRAMLLSGQKASQVLDLSAVNPLAVQWAQDHAADLVAAPADVRAAIRTLIERSIAEGIPPRELARMIRDTVGLTVQQSIAVLNFSLRLAQQNIPEPTRIARLDRYVDAQRQARGLTIARTELIGALNGGQQALWSVAIQQGVIQASQFRKVWIVTPDDALEAECEGLADEEVGVEEPFSSGDMAPPAHPNCRCAIGLVNA